jgi:hypothetical protein
MPDEGNSADDLPKRKISWADFLRYFSYSFPDHFSEPDSFFSGRFPK